MKPYKKYGDFYKLSKQIRNNLKTNGFHGSRQGLYSFWHEQAKKCFLENQIDLMYGYLSMVALAEVIDDCNHEKDRIFWWRMFVISFRFSFK